MSAARYQHSGWQGVQRGFLRDNSFCLPCLGKGERVAAKHARHKFPPGTQQKAPTDYSLLIGLCPACARSHDGARA